MTPSIDQQRATMRALVAAYYEVGLAHLQYARNVDDETLEAHHEARAQEAFDKAEHYQGVMQRFIDKKFNLQKD